MLVASPTGRVILRQTLAAELCGELLSFLSASCSLRRLAAPYLSPASSARQNTRIAELKTSPSTVDQLFSSIDAPAVQHELQGQLEIATSLFRSVARDSEALMSNFVVDGAPFQVNIGSKIVLRLLAVTARMSGSFSASLTVNSDTIADLISLLREAEHEVFILIVSGPAFRLLQDLSRFGAWAAAERASLLMAI